MAPSVDCLRGGHPPGRAPRADARAQGPGGHPRPDDLGPGDLPSGEGGAGPRRPARDAPGPLPPAAGRPRGGRLAGARRARAARPRRPGRCCACFRRERDHAVRVPESLVRALAEAQSTGLQAWREARDRPHLRPLRPRPRAAARAATRAGRRHRARGRALRRAARPLRAGDDHRRGCCRSWSGCGRRWSPWSTRSTERSADRRSSTARRFDPERQWQLHARAARAAGLRPRTPAGRTGASTPSPGARTRTDVRLTTRIDPTNPLARALRHPARAAGTASTSRALPPSTTARRWPPRRRWDCTSRSRACGRTWSAAACRSGGSSTRGCSAAFPEALGGVDARGLPPGHQPGASLAHPRRGRRGHLQPAHRAPHQLEIRLLRDELAVKDLPAAWNAEMETHGGAPPAGRHRGRAPGHPLGARASSATSPPTRWETCMRRR